MKRVVVLFSTIMSSIIIWDQFFNHKHIVTRKTAPPWEEDEE